MANLRRQDKGTLGQLARKIEGLHGRIARIGKQTTPLAIDAGELLLEAQSRIKKRGWNKWVKARIGNRQTAWRYMGLAKYAKRNPKNRKALLKLSLCEAYVKAGVMKNNSGKPHGTNRGSNAPTLGEILSGVRDRKGPKAQTLRTLLAESTPNQLAKLLPGRVPVFRPAAPLVGEDAAWELLDSDRFRKSVSKAAKKSGYLVLVVNFKKKED